MALMSFSSISYSLGSRFTGGKTDWKRSTKLQASRRNRIEAKSTVKQEFEQMNEPEPSFEPIWDRIAREMDAEKVVKSFDSLCDCSVCREYGYHF